MQAARGTAIAETTTDRRVWSRRTAVATMVGVGAALTIVDQLAKAWAAASLHEGERVPLLGPLLQLDLIRNPGAAFSLGTRFTWAFALLACTALAALLAYALPRVRVRWWCIAVGLFIAGVAGNLVDRLIRPPGILRGHVVDFLELPHWPIFNVADMCITGGATLVIVLSLFGRLNYDGQARDAKADMGAPADAEPVDGAQPSGGAHAADPAAADREA